MDITLSGQYWFFSCPFLGSRNSCGALQKKGINVCPISIDYTLKPPAICPLLKNSITVKLEK